MDCRTFESLLADFEGGRVTPADRELVENHLAACIACRCLLEIARGNLELMPTDRRQDLMRSILARTSGSACHRAEELLCDFADGALEGGDAALISEHVGHCRDCSALLAGLVELREVLPQLAELQPDEHFTDAVMRATAGRQPRLRPGAGTRLMDWWDRTLRRPRFSLEAAYVGTLVVAIFLGNPFPAVRALSVRTVEAASQLMLPGIARRDPPFLQSVKALTVDVSNREQEIRAHLERVRQRGESAVTASVDYQMQNLQSFWNKGKQSGRDFWKRYWQGKRKA